MGTVTRIFDGLANVLTGRGTTADRSMHNVWRRRFSTSDQVNEAYLASWLHRKIVDVPAQDMTRAGRDWDATDDEITKIEAEEKRLGYWPKLREAVRLGRLGGGAILVGLGDDPDQPLPANIRPGQIQYLMVLSRWQLTLGELEYDPAAPLFNQPRWFKISGLAREVTIHPSRLICFHGLPVPMINAATTLDDRFWGMSVVEACDEAVQQATTACSGFASLIDEAKIDVFRFKGTVDQLSQPDGEAKLLRRVELTNTGKSVHRAVILDSEDEWEQRQLTLAGVRDVIITYDARVAGAADIPATRLFGKAPDGQNSTGESDLANYFQAIGAKQEMDLRPALERLDVAVLPSAGVKAGLSWNFSPLRVLSEREEAEIEKLEAETVTSYANAGLIPESALAKSVQNRLIESQRWPGLQDAIEEAEAAGEELPEGEEEIDLVPTGAEVVPLRRAANDTAPRTLYVSRKVKNVADLKAWAREQGLPDLQDDLHVTIAYSTTPVDWIKMGSSWADNGNNGGGEMVINAGGPRVVEPLGDRTAVLMFASSDLSWRNREMREAGASWEWPDYQPHISLTAEPVDLAVVQPYRGKIVLGPEIFEEIRSEGA